MQQARVAVARADAERLQAMATPDGAVRNENSLPLF
jgi:hypothetical protein